MTSATSSTLAPRADTVTFNTGKRRYPVVTISRCELVLGVNHLPDGVRQWPQGRQ